MNDINVANNESDEYSDLTDNENFLENNNESNEKSEDEIGKEQFQDVELDDSINDLTETDLEDNNVKTAETQEPSEHIEKLDVSDLPEHVQTSLENYEKNGWDTYQSLPGERTRYNSEWHNRDHDLPDTDTNGNRITYHEHDVNKCQNGHRRDAERFVTGSDNSVYYTNDHYNSFKRIR